MRHWVYNIRGSDPDPINHRGMKSWFYFYRWRMEEEVWLPVQELDVLDLMPAQDDVVWLVMDGRILGSSPILRVEESFPSGRYELWYDARNVRELKVPKPLPSYLSGPLRTLFSPADPSEWEALLHAP